MHFFLCLFVPYISLHIFSIYVHGWSSGSDSHNSQMNWEKLIYEGEKLSASELELSELQLQLLEPPVEDGAGLEKE